MNDTELLISHISNLSKNHMGLKPFVDSDDTVDIVHYERIK